MWDMYRPRAVKAGVLWAGITAAGILLALNRTQALVDDTAFMDTMIPHHSIAINNARKAQISDPRVRCGDGYRLPDHNPGESRAV